MRAAGDDIHGARMRALIVLLWRAGAAHQRSADLDRARPRRASRSDPGPARQGRPPPRGRHGSVGLGPPPPLARVAHAHARRAAAVRDQPTDPWPVLGERRRPRPAPARRRQGRAAAAVRAPPPAAPRPRGRARPRSGAAQRHPAPVGAYQSRRHVAGSGRGAVPALPPVRFPAPPSEPDVHVPAHPALHRTCDGRSRRRVRQRRLPVEWWLDLFRWPPTARGCGGRDSDTGSPKPRRAKRASRPRGRSSDAPNTVA